MSRRSYSGNAIVTTLNGTITNAATTLTVIDGTGYPSGIGGAFVVTLDAGLASEEKVLVAARSGSTFSGLTRGYDGTTATAHSTGASVRHTISAVDLDEANAHVNGTSNVHGVTGSVVGTSDTQTLTNKTLGSGTVFPSTVVDTTTAQTLTNKTLGSGTVLPATVVDTTTAQTLTNKTLGSGTVLPSTVVDTTSSQTVSGKTLSGVQSLTSQTVVGTAGTQFGYFTININGTLFKVAIFNP
jgi:hypothetical protein